MKIIIIHKKILFLMIACFAFVTSLHFIGKDILSVFYQKEYEPIRHGDTSVNKIAFTCNVDWGNEVIPQMLDILDQENVKITFFITGRWAANNSDMLKLIYENGHEIGNHGYSHKLHSKISKEQNIAEISKTEAAIKKVTGFKTRLFAPPAGDFNQTTLEAADILGYQTILWSIDTIDWRQDSTASVIIERVMKKPHAGGILLMHPKPETLKALPTIIHQLKEKNIHIGTVTDLLE
ncbi:MAG: polysaccharide deacetylase family protein [Bacillota bacterium]